MSLRREWLLAALVSLVLLQAAANAWLIHRLYRRPSASVPEFTWKWGTSAEVRNLLDYRGPSTRLDSKTVIADPAWVGGGACTTNNEAAIERLLSARGIPFYMEAVLPGKTREYGHLSLCLPCGRAAEASEVLEAAEKAGVLTPDTPSVVF